MEYVQTVLVQIEASKIDEASRPLGLLADLDEHLSYLQMQRGFLDMRVTRSINPEGNVLLVVETLWRDDTSLIDYETREPNVTGILNKHLDIIIADSLQVLDMEAIRAEASPAHDAAEASQRLALPLLLPVGILAFALLVIYGLSRIYLEVSTDAATGLAAGIAVGLLATAWLVASNPAIKGWQIGLIAAVAVAVLVGGATFALVDDDGGEPAGAVGEPDASPAADASPAPDGATGGLAMSMGDNFFDFQGEQAPTIEVTAGEETTFDLTNDGIAIHNMRIAGVDNEYNTDDDFVSDPNLFLSGDAGTITSDIDQPGTYIFRCDFHPIEMTGTLEVR
ncbi:MAG: plastocyanin/azurin family copper-binding protein [Dehalococcoidia bacterium]